MSLNSIKRFLFVGPTVNLFDASNSKLLTNIFLIVEKLINENKSTDLLNVLNDYTKSYANYTILNKNSNKVHSNIDCVIYLLACCSKLTKDEQFTHKVYDTLVEVSETPMHLFAFEYYRNSIQEVEINSKNNNQPGTSGQDTNERKKTVKHIGRGHKKALTKWYTNRNEIELLRLLTQFKHSYNWTNKDLFKLIHMKPKNEGFDFIMKYIMFGYDKVKDEKVGENMNNLLQFVKDLNDLKTVKTGQEAADIIRKNKFYFEHVPSKIFKFKEIWFPLIEQMSIQDFCENLHRFLKKDLIKPDSELERFILNSIINKDNPDLKLTSPIYPCLAAQIFEHFTSIKLIKMSHQSSGSSNLSIAERSSQDRLRESLWNSFLSSVQHNKAQSNSSLNTLRIMTVIEVNTQMRNAHTNGLHYLNPIDTSSCILLTLYYLNQNPSNFDVFTASDKLTRIELVDKTTQSQPDLSTIENIFQGFASIEKNPTDKIFEWVLQNQKTYDAYIFLTSSDHNDKKIENEMNFLRINNASSKDSKLVIVNLTGKQSQEETPSSILNTHNLNLVLNGWSFDSLFVLDSFLKGKF